MDHKFFEPTLSTRDGLWRLRITSSVEDELGVLTTQTGFLAFKDEAKATKAYEMLKNNEIAPVFGDKLQPGIYEVSYEKVEVEVA